MLYETKQLLNLLTNGCYLRKKINHSGKEGYTLFTGKENPVVWYIESQVKPLMNVCLKNKKGCYHLSPHLVIKLHGNSSIKKQYKQMRAAVKKHSKPIGESK